MFRRLLPVIVVLATLLATLNANARPPENCDTPRKAVDSVFAWLQRGYYSPEKAARCLEVAGRSPRELQRLAERIKRVYDSKALVVDVNQLSDKADYVDERGLARVVPHPELPDIYVERLDDGRWVWTEKSLAEIDRLYTSSIANRIVARLPESLRGEVFGVQFWQYGAIFLILLFGLIVRKLIQFVVVNRVRSLVEDFGQTWALKLVDVIASPGATLVMAAMLRLSYPHLQLPIEAALALSIAVRVLVVVSIVWAAYRAVDLVAERMTHKAAKTESKLDDQLVPLVRKSLKIFTIVAGGLFILQNLNVNVGSLLAGLGIGGVAVALAAKDTVANFFGSVMIFVDRPFQIGDWVVVSGVEGIVEEVGFRSTRIRTFYNSVVTVPNAKFTEANIDNMGRREYRRTFTTLNLTYNTTPEQMQAFVEGVRAVISANPYTRKDYYEVHMSGFGAHSLDVMVYFFFKVESWTAELRERHLIFLEIMRLARDLGIEFAFPTQTLHLDSVAEPGSEKELPRSPETPKLAEVVHAFGPGGARARPSGPQITDSRYFAATAPAAQNAEDGG